MGWVLIVWLELDIATVYECAAFVEMGGVNVANGSARPEGVGTARFAIVDPPEWAMHGNSGDGIISVWFVWT